MPKTRFFRVAVEGATIDGRTLDAKTLQEMADTYNPATYGARVNLEHIRGVTPDGPFQAYGDVLAVKTETIELPIGGKTEKRLALFAELDAFDPLIAMNKKRQKVYSSIEIQPNFANTGKAYLAGLAVTDSPASLGTEMLQFRTKMGADKAASPLALDPTHLFTAPVETEIEMVVEAPAASAEAGAFAAIKAFFDKFSGVAPLAAPAPAAPAAPAIAEPAPGAAAPAVGDQASFAALAAMMGQFTSTVQAFVTKSETDAAALRSEMAALKTSIDNTPAAGFTQRPAATGGEIVARTDC